MNLRLIILLTGLFNAMLCMAQNDDIELIDENSSEWGGEGGGGLTPQTPTGVVSSLTLSQTTATLAGGETLRLVATVNSDAQNKNITWVSNNPAVASVDSYGFVCALKKGSAIITATAVGNTSLQRTCTVTVTSDFRLGDVNGNDGIDIGDAVSVVNYLVGKDTSTFIEKAADTNKNGQIDIGDAVTIVNYLVGKTASLSRKVDTDWDEREPQ